MQSVPFHIAYLLTRYECVIVPGLGAFVVFSSNIEKANREALLLPPENFLGFNPEIRHNDGLLANSIAKENVFSFNEANLLIAQYVTTVFHTLDMGKKVKIPGVGTLYSNNNKRLFQPDSNLSCNALYYGFSGFTFPYLNNLHGQSSVPEKKNKDIVLIPVNRRLVTYFVSVAAAVIAMCIIPTPLNNSSRFSPANTQQAGIILFSKKKQPIDVAATTPVSESDILMPTDSLSTRQPIDSHLTQQKNTPSTAPSKVLEISQPQVKISKKATAVPTPRYYIVIASLTNESSAKITLTKIQSTNFKNAEILYSDERYRIYTNCFDDETEANRFLIQFKKDNKAYRDAWILKQNK